MRMVYYELKLLDFKMISRNIGSDYPVFDNLRASHHLDTRPSSFEVPMVSMIVTLFNSIFPSLAACLVLVSSTMVRYQGLIRMKISHPRLVSQSKLVQQNKLWTTALIIKSSPDPLALQCPRMWPEQLPLPVIVNPQVSKYEVVPLEMVLCRLPLHHPLRLYLTMDRVHLLAPLPRCITIIRH